MHPSSFSVVVEPAVLWATPAQLLVPAMDDKADLDEELGVFQLPQR